MQRLERAERRGAAAAAAEFALHAGCRRAALLAFFGERGGRCRAGADLPCDFCAGPAAVAARLARLEAGLAGGGAGKGAGTARSAPGEASEASRGCDEPGEPRRLHGQPSAKRPAWRSASRRAAKQACREQGVCAAAAGVFTGEVGPADLGAGCSSDTLADAPEPPLAATAGVRSGAQPAAQACQDAGELLSRPLQQAIALTLHYTNPTLPCCVWLSQSGH